MVGAVVLGAAIVVTAATIGGYTIATAIGVDAVNTTVAIGTGTNYIAKGAYKLLEMKTKQKKII